MLYVMDDLDDDDDDGNNGDVLFELVLLG